MRDFLTCLASPNGHRVAFSYRKTWIAPALLEQGLVGREATIVFCDRPSRRARAFSFLGVRHATLTRLIPSETSDVLPESAVIVEFRLGPLLAARDADLPQLRERWQQTIGMSHDRPRPGGVRSAARPRFVFESEALAESDGAVTQQESWRSLSVALGNCATLSDAFFFRVGAMRKPGGRPGEGKAVTVGSAGELSQVYELRTSGQYELPLEAYARSGRVPYSDAISATPSSSTLAVVAVTQSTAGRASEAVIVIQASEVYRPQVGTVIVAGQGEYANRVPRVEIAARVTRNNWIAAALVLLIALGVFASGIAPDWLGTGDWSYVINAVGSLIAAAVTVVAIGRGISK